VSHELPGVGENLRDHYVPRTRWLVGKKGITFNDRGRGLGLAHQALRYALFRQVLDWVRSAAETTYHPVGTCKMGSDPMAVVDAQLRVHGITGLRIADASIMPTLTSGNTNAPSIMIGEKAAEMLLNIAH
jgi:choline dehydrogenase-like flavoprotein